MARDHHRRSRREYRRPDAISEPEDSDVSDSSSYSDSEVSESDDETVELEYHDVPKHHEKQKHHGHGHHQQEQPVQHVGPPQPGPWSPWALHNNVAYLIWQCRRWSEGSMEYKMYDKDSGRYHTQFIPAQQPPIPQPPQQAWTAVNPAAAYPTAPIGWGGENPDPGAQAARTPDIVKIDMSSSEDEDESGDEDDHKHKQKHKQKHGKNEKHDKHDKHGSPKKGDKHKSKQGQKSRKEKERERERGRKGKHHREKKVKSTYDHEKVVRWAESVM